MTKTIIPLIACLAFTTTASQGQQPTFETTQVADGVFQYRHQGHNSFFVVSDGGVIAFDPISTEAASHYADEIKRVAPGKSLLAIVYSHSHADHTTGAVVLQEAFGVNVPVIAQENARAEIERLADPDLPPPTVTFTKGLTLHLGGRPIVLTYLGRNHSDNSLVAVVPDARVAFAVDFVSMDRVGYRDLGSFHLPDLFQSLMELRNLDFETIVFGHGPTGTVASVDRQIQYYNDLRTAVEAAVHNGMSEDETADHITLAEYAGWGGYDDWFKMNVRGMYRWAVGR